ncbi:MAG TPA: hypothetical protein VFK89_10090, partial [Actinomycetota bacterium]|nr:hypothetical protein [Actinomycetota bacterium]
MKSFYEVIQWVNAGAFLGLALLTLRLWVKRRDKPSFWMAVTFADLGVLTVIGRVIQVVNGDRDLPLIATKFIVAVLLLFPYFLFRVANSFTPASKTAQRLAAVLTVAVVVWTFLLPTFPSQGEARSGTFELFVIGILIQWTALSAVVAFKFWVGGRGQPPVARARMRLLAAAAAILSLALVISGAAPGDRPLGVDVGVSLLTLVVVTIFYLAFAPPGPLRAAWRRPAEEGLRRAVIDLMGAVTDQAVVDG